MSSFSNRSFNSGASAKRMYLFHLNMSYNNIFVALADEAGNILVTKSGGSMGFSGSKKIMPLAVRKTAEFVANRAKVIGVVNIRVLVQGPGTTAFQDAVKGIVSQGLNLVQFRDITPIAFNGVRRRKRRRV